MDRKSLRSFLHEQIQNTKARRVRGRGGRMIGEIEIHMELLRKAADNLEARFLSPVYLVGSFQNSPMDALDVDIVMVMTEARILRLFRTKEYCFRRFAFNKKQKLEIEEFIKPFDIDFKVQSQDEFSKYTKQNTKLGKYVEFPL